MNTLIRLYEEGCEWIFNGEGVLVLMILFSIGVFIVPLVVIQLASMPVP